MHGLIEFLAELFVADEALARSALTAATAATSKSSRIAARAHSGANRFRGVLTIETSYPQVKGLPIRRTVCSLASTKSKCEFPGEAAELD
jgi:hypothetical protein